MYCANCRIEVEAPNGYCSRCGMAINARLCPNGHVMDPSWSECKYCPPGAQAKPAAGGFGKGRTVVEGPGGGLASPPAGGFVKGATLLEDPVASGFSGKGRTVVEGAGPKGPSAPESGAGRGKQRTVFDPGLAGAAAGAPAEKVPAAPKPKLVGWLVTFSLDASGADFRVREGRNVIGADSADCDIVLSGAPSVSGRHAVLMFREGRFQLRDNDSTNGTYVNGEDVFGQGAVTVKDRDRIRVGEVELLLVAL